MWRRGILDKYYKVVNTVTAVTSENRDSVVSEYPVNPPLPVEGGDIYQSVDGNSRLRVYYAIRMHSLKESIVGGEYMDLDSY